MSLRRMRAVLPLVTLALTSIFGVNARAQEKAAPPSQAEPEKKAEGWQQEFDDICAKTQDAMTLTVAELKALVQRSDALEPRIEKLDETRRKVYLRRLKQCRGLYSYVLESKNDASKK
jgi:cell division protein FtsB